MYMLVHPVEIGNVMMYKGNTVGINGCEYILGVTSNLMKEWSSANVISGIGLFSFKITLILTSSTLLLEHQTQISDSILLCTLSPLLSVAVYCPS
jgi:hypothetical protein